MPKGFARTHTSGRTKSVQDAPTTNDHDCRDAKPTKRSYRDREQALFLKNILFLQAELTLSVLVVRQGSVLSDGLFIANPVALI